MSPTSPNNSIKRRKYALCVRQFCLQPEVNLCMASTRANAPLKDTQKKVTQIQ